MARTRRHRLGTMQDIDGDEFELRLHTIRKYNRPKRCRLNVYMYFAKLASLDPNRQSTAKDKKRWTRMGKRYGFPACCIKSFCTISVDDRTESQRLAMGDGFVPCPTHAKMIVMGQTTREQLIRNRTHSLPFPKGY